MNYGCATIELSHHQQIAGLDPPQQLGQLGRISPSRSQNRTV